MSRESSSPDEPCAVSSSRSGRTACTRKAPTFVPASPSYSRSSSFESASSASPNAAEQRNLDSRFPFPSQPYADESADGLRRLEGTSVRYDARRTSSDYMDQMKRRAQRKDNQQGAQREKTPSDRQTSSSSLMPRCVENTKRFILSDDKVARIAGCFSDEEILDLIRLILCSNGNSTSTLLFVSSREPLLDLLAAITGNFSLKGCDYVDPREAVLNRAVRVHRCNCWAHVKRIRDVSNTHRVFLLTDKQFLDLMTTNATALEHSTMLFDCFTFTSPLMVTCFEAVSRMIYKHHISVKTVILAASELHPAVSNPLRNVVVIRNDCKDAIKAICYMEKDKQCCTVDDSSYLEESLNLVQYLVGSQLCVPVARPFWKFTKFPQVVRGDILVFALSPSEAALLAYAIQRNLETLRPYYQELSVKVFCFTEYSSFEDRPESSRGNEIRIYIVTDNATCVPKAQYVIDSGLIRRNYFDQKLKLFCSKIVEFSRYSGSRRASHAVPLLGSDGTSLESSAFVFVLKPAEECLLVNPFDELFERDGEVQLVAQYRKHLRLNSEGTIILAAERESLQVTQFFPFLNSAYSALLSSTVRTTRSVDELFATMFALSLLSLEPLFIGNREAKYLLDELNQHTSASYFSLFVRKVLTILKGKNDDSQAPKLITKVAHHVKTRVSLLVSLVFQLVESSPICGNVQQLGTTLRWPSLIVEENVSGVYLRLCRRNIAVHNLNFNNSSQVAVTVAVGGEQVALQSCDGIDFCESPNFDFAFNFVELRNNNCFVSLPYASPDSGNFCRHMTFFKKFCVGPSSRSRFLPLSLSTVTLDKYGFPSVFLTTRSPNDPSAILFLVSDDEKQLESAKAVLDDEVTTCFSQLLHESHEIALHERVRNASTIMIGSGGTVKKHIFKDELNEPDRTPKRFDKPNISSSNDLFPRGDGSIWQVKRKGQSQCLFDGTLLTRVSKEPKLNLRSVRYTGILCKYPKQSTEPVGRITIEGEYSSDEIIPNLLEVFPNALISYKDIAARNSGASTPSYTPQAHINDKEVHVVGLSPDDIEVFPGAVRQALSPIKVSDTFVTAHKSVNLQKLQQEIESHLRAVLQKFRTVEAFQAIKFDWDWESCEFHSGYIWAECSVLDLHEVVAAMNDTMKRGEMLKDCRFYSVVCQYCIFPRDTFMCLQSSVTEFMLKEKRCGVMCEVAELPDGRWIATLCSPNLQSTVDAFERLSALSVHHRFERERAPAIFTREGIAWLHSLQEAFWPYVFVDFSGNSTTEIYVMIEKSMEGAVTTLIHEFHLSRSAESTSADQSACCACFQSDDRNLLLECGHTICEECRDSMIEVVLPDGRFPILCPEDKCHREVAWRDIERWLICKNPSCVDCSSHEETWKLSRASYKHHVNSLANLHRLCTTPDCLGYFVKSQSPLPNCDRRCPECQVMKCMSCGANAHENMSCEENDALTKDSQRSLDFWIGQDPENRKKCVRCKMVILKEAGCAHVSCTICHAHICWVCEFVTDTAPELYKHLLQAHQKYV